MTKRAMVLIRDRFKAAGYYPRAVVILQVYDEVAAQAPTVWRAEVERIIDTSMIEAGQEVITKVPVIVEGHIGPTWTK